MTAVVTDEVARAVQVTVTFDPLLDGAAGKPWVIDWGDGTVTSYTAATTVVNRNYAKDGNYVIQVQDMNGDTRTHENVLVGDMPYPVWDPQKVQPTPAERQARKREQIAAIGYAKRYIG
jgi:hypothetical protein